MIKQLRIQNFKSIKSVDFSCKKLNVFIGEPNGGKSNLIEALCLFDLTIIGSGLPREIFRYNSMADLFFDFNVNKPIIVQTNELSYELKYPLLDDGSPLNRFDYLMGASNSNYTKLQFSNEGSLRFSDSLISTRLKYYQYKRLNEFKVGSFAQLSSPYGDNLPGLLLSNEDFRNWVSEFFESKGFSLTLKPTEQDMNMSKIVNKIIYSYPYYATSETMQRIIFYIMAIMSSKNSVLLFDEPESNTFPLYTKFLAERIALDESNQFFLTTHNPYLLLSLIEKSSENDLNVCVVRMKNYETVVTPLNREQLGEVLDFNSDVFLNLDRIVD